MAQVRYCFLGLLWGPLEVVRFRGCFGAGYRAPQALGIEGGVGSNFPVEPANRFGLA